MEKKLNGLIITYCYPPYQSPESFVTYKLLNALSNYCNLTIIKPKIEQIKYANQNLSQKNIKEIEIPIPNYIRNLLSLKRLPLRPDRFLFYYPFFKKRLLQINMKKFDFFMTRSQFHSSHLLGLFLKKKFKIPWFAHFSDPWVDNPVQKKIFFLEHISLILQKKIFSKTDINMFPLNELKNHFNKQLDKDIKKNSFIVPHSITKVFKINKKQLKKIAIRFFGKIYAGRKVKNTLIAISNLVKKDKRIIAEFYVDDDFFENYQHLINQFSNIKFFNYLNYSNYLKKLNETSILILIDIDEEYGNLFFQSKLVDYLQSCRQILHIGKSLTYNKNIILKNNGMSCTNDPIQIYNKLSTMIKQTKKFKPNYDLIENFSSENVALKVFKKIQKIVKNDSKKL